MKLRRYLINGWEEEREYFLDRIRGEITREQYEQLLKGEVVEVNGNTFCIDNVEGL